MEILFEEIVEGMPWYGCAGIALIVFVFGFLFGLFASDGEVILAASVAIVMSITVFVVALFARADTYTLYTVRVTDDSGYRLMVENYSIEEQRANDIYVIKEK